MDQAWNVTQQRQQDVEPKVKADANLKKDT
jgi:hypothetical protein